MNHDDLALSLGLPPLGASLFSSSAPAGVHPIGAAIESHPARVGAPVQALAVYPGGISIGAMTRQTSGGLPQDARPMNEQHYQGSQGSLPREVFHGVSPERAQGVVRGLPALVHGGSEQRRELSGRADAHPERLGHVIANVQPRAVNVDGGTSQIYSARGVAPGVFPERRETVGTFPSHGAPVPAPRELPELPPL